MKVRITLGMTELRDLLLALTFAVNDGWVPDDKPDSQDRIDAHYLSERQRRAQAEGSGSMTETTLVKYKIVRFYQNGTKRTIKAGVFLWEAQKHCDDPENSSRTCTSKAGRNRTRFHGPWFDGYVRLRG